VTVVGVGGGLLAEQDDTGWWLFVVAPAAFIMSCAASLKLSGVQGTIGRLAIPIGYAVTFPAWFFMWSAFILDKAGLIGCCSHSPEIIPASVGRALWLAAPSLTTALPVWCITRSIAVAIVVPLVAAAASLLQFLDARPAGALAFGGWHASVAAALCIWASYTRATARSATQCRHCGYDLAGLESDVCPECGKARLSR
jgi:hypothetical protein